MLHKYQISQAASYSGRAFAALSMGHSSSQLSAIMYIFKQFVYASGMRTHVSMIMAIFQYFISNCFAARKLSQLSKRHSSARQVISFCPAQLIEIIMTKLLTQVNKLLPNVVKYVMRASACVYAYANM